MARIRTIKPEFFTSEDIVSLSPLARLLYIAIWCEADKEGRMAWKPRTLKMRYLPADDCDILALCQEIVDAGLVKLYGEGLAYIPQFSKHQHINPRESASTMPDPSAREIDASSTRHPRVSTCANQELTHREEGKGRECIDDASQSSAKSQGSRLLKDWVIPSEWSEWAIRECGWSQTTVAHESAKFQDYWVSKPGKDGRKADWLATWRNWCRNSRSPAASGPSSVGSFV